MARERNGSGQKGKLGKGRLTVDFCTHSSNFPSSNLSSAVSNAIGTATATTDAVWKEEEWWRGCEKSFIEDWRQALAGLEVGVKSDNRQKFTDNELTRTGVATNVDSNFLTTYETEQNQNCIKSGIERIKHCLTLVETVRSAVGLRMRVADRQLYKQPAASKEDPWLD
jgi:hypothetical protein